MFARSYAVTECSTQFYAVVASRVYLHWHILDEIVVFVNWILSSD